MIGALVGAIASSGIASGPSPVDYGTLIVDIDPANAVLTSGKISSIGAGLGSYAFQQTDAARRPLLNATDADFNGMPSIDFDAASTQYLVSSADPNFGGDDTITLVLVAYIESTSTAVLIETSADPNGNPGCVTLYNDGTSLHPFYSGATGTPDLAYNFGAINAKRYIGAEFDLGVTSSATGASLYVSGSEVSLSGSGTITTTTVATKPWYLGVRGSGTSFPFTGRIARVLGYRGVVDHAGLYSGYLQPTYG